MQWNIPNTLTFLHLLAAPGVAVMFLYFHHPWADWFALTFFVVAAMRLDRGEGGCVVVALLPARCPKPGLRAPYDDPFRANAAHDSGNSR
jgi:hypothetical protein